MTRIKQTTKRIVVVSQLTADTEQCASDNSLEGWQTCLLLAKRLQGSGIELVHVCDHQMKATQGSVTLDEQDIGLFESLGIDERALIKQTNGNLCLAHQYLNWSSDGHSFINAHSPFGVDFEGIGFHHFLGKLKLNETKESKKSNQALFHFHNYSLSAKSAQLGRFSHPASAANAIQSTLTYQLHCEQALYIELIRQQCLKLGVTEITADITAIVTAETTGLATMSAAEITSIEFTEHETLDGDFFIDCTGCYGLLSRATLEGKRQSLSDCFPSNSRLCFSVALAANQADVTFMPVIETTEFGWFVATPLKNSIVYQCFFNSADFHQDEILGYFTSQRSLNLLNIPQVQKLDPGRVEHSWQGNCLAVGQTALQAEVTMDSRLNQLAVDIDRWLEYYPFSNQGQLLTLPFNRKCQQAQQNMIDFAMLPFILSSFRDENYWQRVMKITPSESLSYQLTLFRSCGVLPVIENRIVPLHFWHTLLIGFQYWPKAVDPLLSEYDEQALTKKLENLALMVERAAKQLHLHDNYMRSICF